LKVLTYNLWHGLAPADGLLYFKKLEPETRRIQRQIMQQNLLVDWAADVACLQEVNPLPERSHAFASVSDNVLFGQPDLAGIKWHGRGLPLNLNSGLLTLVKKKYLPRLLGSVKLSGSPFSLEARWMSVQWRETRFAQLIEIMDPTMGRVLIINLHLHHGLENSSELRSHLQEGVKSGEISGQVALEIEMRLAQGDERRLAEISVLLERLNELQQFDVMVLSGDLNAGPESAVLKALKRFGFQDLAEVSGVTAPTFDRVENEANHVFLHDFPLTVDLGDLSFDPELRRRLQALLRRFEGAPRRVDYVLVRALKGAVKIKSFETVGRVDEKLGFAPSDHFGCLCDFQLEM